MSEKKKTDYEKYCESDPTVKFEERKKHIAWFKREFPDIIEYLLYIIKKESFTEGFEKFREVFGK